MPLGAFHSANSFPRRGTRQAQQSPRGDISESARGSRDQNAASYTMHGIHMPAEATDIDRGTKPPGSPARRRIQIQAERFWAATRSECSKASAKSSMSRADIPRARPASRQPATARSTLPRIFFARGSDNRK